MQQYDELTGQINDLLAQRDEVYIQMRLATELKPGEKVIAPGLVLQNAGEELAIMKRIGNNVFFSKGD